MIRGEKVTLRPFTQDDLALFSVWWNDKDYLSEYNFFGFNPTTHIERDFQDNGMLDRKHGSFVIATNEGDVAGDISYRPAQHGPGSLVYAIGISLAPDHRGKGYGVEAQRLLAEYLFATHPIMRVEASTDITNIAEQRALEKAGFVREGVARKAQWRNGEWHDMVFYSLLRGE